MPLSSSMLVELGYVSRVYTKRKAFLLKNTVHVCLELAPRLYLSVV